jgi:hypothetical protein
MAEPLRVLLGEWQSDEAFRRAIKSPVELIPVRTLRGWTVETFRYRWAVIDENLRLLSAGEPLLNVVKAPSAI